MPAHPMHRSGRVVSVLAWALNSPRRALAVTIVVALVGALALVGLISAVAGRAGGGRGQVAAADRSSCQSVTQGFVQSFFASPRDASWAARVSPWVDPELSGTIADIDPASVPDGVPSRLEGSEEAGACDVLYALNPGGTRIRVEASTPAGDGVWYVTAWDEVRDERAPGAGTRSAPATRGATPTATRGTSTPSPTGSAPAPSRSSAS